LVGWLVSFLLTLSPIWWALGALSLGTEWPGHEADHSPLSNVKVSVWSYIFTSSVHIYSKVLN